MMRRGAIGPDRLAWLILAIVGFAIAALFIFGIFNNESLTNRDLCRLSILSRATVPGIVEDTVPLNCHTEKICLTLDTNLIDTIKGKDTSCRQFAGEGAVREVEVTLKPAMTLEEQKKSLHTIQSEVANAMYDCWLMTGQGKLDIWTTQFKPSQDIIDKLESTALEDIGLNVKSIEPRCIVCSRIALSDALLEANNKTKAEDNVDLLSQINYNRFLSQERIEGSSQTYFEAFTDKSVGSGYGTISHSEELGKYSGKTEVTDSELTEIKSILTKQFADKLAQPSGKDGKTIGQYITELDKKTVISYLSSLSQKTYSRDNQLSVVFTQIKVPGKEPTDQFWDTFKSGAIVGGVGAVTGPGKIMSFFIPGPGWAKMLVKLGTIGATSWSLAADAETIARTNQALSAATCGRFESRLTDENGNEVQQQGCSLVKLVNWDVNTINSLCTGGIEGNL